MATRKKNTRSDASKQTTTKKAAKKAASRKKTTPKTRKTEVKKSSVREKVGHVAIADSTGPAIKSKNKAVKGRNSSLPAVATSNLPTVREQFIVQTARIAGMTFVAVGAAMTFINVQALDSGTTFDAVNGQSASTIDTTTETVSTEEDLSSNDVETEPPVDFQIESSDELSGTVELEYVVADAADMKVGAFYQQDEKYIWFGRPDQIDDLRWRYSWDTTEYPDGTYRLMAIVTNEYGTYEEKDSSYVTVTNTATEENLDSSADDPFAEDPDLETETTETETTLTEPPAYIKVVRDEIQEHEMIVTVTVARAEEVSLSAQHHTSGDRIDLGTTYYDGADTWKLRWDTTDHASGTYELYADITNSERSYQSDRISFELHGETADADVESGGGVDTSEPARITEMEDPLDVLVPDISIEVTDRNLMSGTEEVTVFVDEARFVELYGVANYGLTPHFLGLARKDSDGVWRFAMDTTQTPNGNYELFARVKNAYGLYDSNRVFVTIENATTAERSFQERIYVEQVKEVTQATSTASSTEQGQTQEERIEQLTRERIGDKVFEDSDGDGISDYDEVRLYSTDPFVADSDSDGFTDGAEVAQGYDPTDPEPEVLVEYESPKERGVVRDDILKVESITSVEPDEGDTGSDGVTPVAVISGTALPNSYVTLYIFSTPIVVTVRTGDDGSWSYTFDKELPDGEHEVYAAVTDNAGRIVAKSDPFAFIKTAEAFTSSDDVVAVAPVVSQSNSGPAVLSESAVLAISSAAVIILGLILLLLGMHIRDKRQPHVAFQ